MKRKILNKIKKYKILVAVIIGAILLRTIVYASTTYIGSGSDLTYNNSESGLSSTNVQDAIDELYEMKCPSGYACFKRKTTLALGDYVSLTPTKSSYTTDTSMTGYSSTQTINPQELNLWRVISLNDDGTVDIISEYVSSIGIYFEGLTGYLNLVGYLNVLASQYENSEYTTGSRHFGYNGQTEYITDTTMMTADSHFTSSTGSKTVESQGGGDTLYENDFLLTTSVLRSRVATNPSGAATAYYMASRHYGYWTSDNYYWLNRYVSESGGNTYSYLYGVATGSYKSEPRCYALRPILTLKSGLNYDGYGTKNYPMEITE